MNYLGFKVGAALARGSQYYQYDNDTHYDLDNYYHYCIFQGLLIFAREMNT